MTAHALNPRTSGGKCTARSAARDTRRAIERVRKAMSELRNVGRRWVDLDSGFATDCANLPDLPAEVAYLATDLDVEYPRRLRR
jgi:hypothetical protein